MIAIIFSENGDPLFRIMLLLIAECGMRMRRNVFCTSKRGTNLA